MVKEKIAIPVHPIIRPRGGDFLYNDDEFSIMQKDILLCKQLGYEGAVIGLLNADGTVDKQRTAQLTDLAYPMDITFHRAFDRTVDAFQAMEDIINCGCTRILTSGQHPYAMDGKELIKGLIEQADGRIIIMPGSGIRSNNIKELTAYTGTTELHSSARRNVQSNMFFTQASMQESLDVLIVDEQEIQSMIQQINN